MRRSLSIVPALLATPIAFASACQTATEITIDVTTDIDCAAARGTLITVGHLGEGGGIEDKPATSSTTTCVSGRIGALVVVPSGAKDDQVAVKIVTGNARDVDECIAPTYGKGCIVARRALRFIPHAALTVPVVMRGICDGVACDPKSTCVKGRCVDATIPSSEACRGAGCDEGTLTPIGAGDGGAPDATVDGGGSDGSVSAAPCDTTGLQPGSPWPMAGQCAAHRSRSPFRGPATQPRIVWSQPLSLLEKAQPIITADGTLIVATYADVQALDGATGMTKWATPFATPTTLATTPALAVDGTITLVTGGSMYGLDPLTGLKKWGPFTPAGDVAAAGLTLDAKGNILFSDDASRIVSTAPTPAMNWSYPTPTDVHSSAPAIDANGFIYVAMTDGVVVLDRSGGFVRTIALSGQGSDTVGIAPDGTLRVQSDPTTTLHARRPDGSIVFDLITGTEQYDFAIGDDGTTYIGLDDGALHAIGPDGMTRWKFPGAGAGSGYSTPTVDAAGVVYAVRNDGSTHSLYAIDPVAGSKIWNIDLPQSVDVHWGPSIGSNGVLYVNGGHVYAVGL